MKTHCTLIALVSLLLVLGLNQALAQTGHYRLGDHLSLRYRTVSEGAQAYERESTEFTYPFMDAHVPGVDIVLLKSDRGTRSGQYLYLYNFEDTARRDFHYPEEGVESRTQQSIHGRYSAELDAWKLENDFPEYTTEGLGYVNYALVGAETLEGRPWIEMLGIHHIQVEEGRGAAFEHFVETKWNPHAHLPAWWILFYKNDRQSEDNDWATDYIMIHALEPGLLRDVYFPEGQSSEVADEVSQPVEGLWEELQSYMVAPAEGEAQWSDFFVVR